MHTLGRTCTFVALTSLLTGCGGGGDAGPTRTVTVTRSAAPIQTIPGSTNAPDSSRSTSQSTTASPTSTEATLGDPAAGGTTPPTTDDAPIISGPINQTRSLTLSDVFAHDQWEEGSVRVPNVKGRVQAIFTDVASCNGGQGVLELRFADQDGVFVVSGGQSLDSASSSITMEYKLEADGRLVDTGVSTFRSAAPLKASLSGVSALRVIVTAQKSEDGSCVRATAVLTNMMIKPK